MLIVIKININETYKRIFFCVCKLSKSKRITSLKNIVTKNNNKLLNACYEIKSILMKLH